MLSVSRKEGQKGEREGGNGAEREALMGEEEEGRPDKGTQQILEAGKDHKANPLPQHQRGLHSADVLILGQ